MKRDLDLTRTLYFAQMPKGGPIKIGCTLYPRKRLSALRCEMMAKPLVMIAQAPGSFRDEATTHRLFADHRIWWEWYDPTPGMLEVIAEINSTGALPVICVAGSASNIGYGKGPSAIKFPSALKFRRAKSLHDAIRAAA